MSLKKWTHPGTGETRVYVNDQSLWRGVKLFFFLSETGSIRFADYCVQGASGLAAKQAQEVANRVGTKCEGEWDKLLAMAS